MDDLIVTVIEGIGTLLGILGVSVLVYALIGGTTGVGAALVVASVIVFVVSVVADRNRYGADPDKASVGRGDRR